MVKVEKPNPRSFKKAFPAKIKKPQMKKPAVNSSNVQAKKIEKALQSVSQSKIVKDIKQKSVDVIKQSKPILASIKKAAQKKEAFVAGVHENIEKTTLKKKPIVPRVQKNLKVQNKAQLPGKVTKNQNTIGDKKKILKIKQNQNLKETKNITAPVLEPDNFDEEKFRDIVCSEKIKKISKALKVLAEEEVSGKKTSIFSDFIYYLNVSSYKIPNCPKRMVKLNLKHSLVDAKTDDVVMIVPDLQRGVKFDYEPTVQHFEGILREIGQEHIKVLTFNQLRNEYSSFEAKRKLANAYDYFLCDGRIIGHVVGFCGKHFQKPRTTIHAVCLKNHMTYKRNIENALKRTAYRQVLKGDMISIPVGNHLFTINQLADNIEVVIDQLKTIFPGGYANIRNIYIKIDIKGTSALPLYVSLVGAPSEVPNVIGPREKRMIKLKKKANDVLSKFNMRKGGDFVKLNKAQVKLKQNIREAQAVLLTKEEDEDDSNPSVRKS